MRIQPGAKLGRYEVIAHIGSGGMGDVYRARDTHLDKQVALKTIATAYARDPASQPRFELERRLTAALEHPHICRLLDAGEQDGTAYLAMEFLDGESLAERLARGPLPVTLAVGYAIEIADALHHAHRHGVVHRDLKPANVFLTGTGAKVLDFGLAKLRPAAPDSSRVRDETVPLDVTQAGAVVGSAPYMAPERLEGHDADQRTDVFAFGVLLYEMLTRRRAFEGNNPAALIAAILSQEPPPLGLQDPAGADLEWIVRKCIAKKPDDRWQSMGDLQIVLKRIAAAGFTRASPEPRRRRAPLAAAVLIPLALAAALGWMVAQRTTLRRAGDPLAMTINPPPGGMFTPTQGSEQTAQLALSPDGSSVAFVAAGGDGISRLWIHRFSSLAPVSIPSTENATFPFWSPDGRSLGFFTDDALRSVDIESGLARTIAEARTGRGGTWSTTGDILFSPGNIDTIMKVSEDSGPVSQATRLDVARGETTHRWPHFLPDGRRFLYFARNTKHQQYEGIYCGSTDGGAPTLVANTSAGAVFVPPDRLLFLLDDTLVSRRMDPNACTLSGTLTPVAERVGSSSNYYGAFSASASGAIAYASSAMASDLLWVDRAGQPAGTVAAGKPHVDFRLSPKGDFVAVAELDQETGGADLHVRDLTRGDTRRITSARATDASPVWSPEGKQIVFRSNRESIHDLYVVDVAGGGAERRISKSMNGKYPTSWSLDGRIAFHTTQGKNGWDVITVDTQGNAATQLITSTRFDEIQGQFSPNGKAIAYTSDVSGRYEVWVQPLPSGVAKAASVNGGTDPRWNSNGSELFYVAAKGQLTAVPIEIRGRDVYAGEAKPLFPVRDAAVTAPFTSVYDVAPDGRFLIRVNRGDARTTPLTVLLNWPLERER